MVLEIPDPSGSPNEKIEIPNKLWPAYKDLNLEKFLLAEGLEPELSRRIARALKHASMEQALRAEQGFRQLQHWANVHTHPGGSGGDLGPQGPAENIAIVIGNTLAIYEPDGTILSSITDGNLNGRMAWNVDGTRVAVMSGSAPILRVFSTNLTEETGWPDLTNGTTPNLIRPWTALNIGGSGNVSVSCSDVSWSPDGKWMVVVGRAGSAEPLFALIDVNTKSVVSTPDPLDLMGAAETVSFSPDSRYIFMGGLDDGGAISNRAVLDLDTMDFDTTWPTPQGYIQSVRWSPSGDFVYINLYGGARGHIIVQRNIREIIHSDILSNFVSGFYAHGVWVREDVVGRTWRNHDDSAKNGTRWVMADGLTDPFIDLSAVANNDLLKQAIAVDPGGFLVLTYDESGQSSTGDVNNRLLVLDRRDGSKVTGWGFPNTSLFRGAAFSTDLGNTYSVNRFID